MIPMNIDLGWEIEKGCENRTSTEEGWSSAANTKSSVTECNEAETLEAEWVQLFGL